MIPLKIQLFREWLSENVHATIPILIVGGFEFTEQFERMTREALYVCLRVLKESNKSKFDSYNVRNSVLIISHITFRICCVHTFSDNLSQNSCICIFNWYIRTQIWETKAINSFVLRFKWFFGSRFLCLYFLIFLGWMNPLAWSNRTQLKISHKAMKIKRRFESILFLASSQLVSSTLCSAMWRAISLDGKLRNK